MSRARLARLLFPGSRAAWLGALVVLIGFAIILGRLVLARTTPLVGTNSVDVATVIASAPAGERTCIRDLVLPRGTRRLEIYLALPASGAAAPIRGTFASGGERWPVRLPAAEPGGGFKAFRLDRAPERDTPGTLCLRSPARVDYGGAFVQRLPGAQVSSVAGQPLTGGDIGVRFLSGEAVPSRLIERLGAALARAALFKDYPGGSLILWLALGSLVAIAYVVVRTAATVDGRSRRQLARRAYAIAFVSGCAWALMMPPFHGADESEHFAYVQHLAVTGDRADAGHTARPPYSSDETFLLGALHHNSTILNASGRPRWSGVYDEQYDRAVRTDPADDDGGGFTEAGSGHSPLYYALMAVPYRALDWALDLPRLVVALRIANAALAALVAALAVLCTAALVPRVPGVWWVAGCLAALQPIFSSVAGTVNNDNLVNVLAALALFLLVDAWSRGPRRSRMVALGLVTTLLPVAKGTGFALWPVIAFGLVLVLVRHRGRPAFGAVPLAPAVAIGAAVAWRAAGGKLLNLHPVDPAAVAASAPGPTVVERVSYLVEGVVPFVQLTGDYWTLPWPLYTVYIERGFGRFGWMTGEGLQSGVLHLVLYSLIAGWLLALLAAWRWRARWREWLGGVAILALAVVCVLGLVAFAYASLVPRGATPPEQGRYIFPALVALVVLLATGATALGERLRAAYYGVATSAIAMLGITAWLTIVRDWFT